MDNLPKVTATMEITEEVISIIKAYDQEKKEFENRFGSMQKKHSLLKQSNKAKKFDSADYYLKAQQLKKK